MNDQQQSRADALTEAERLLLARVNDCTKPIDAADRNGILKLIDRLAACPVEQPASAPIDTPTDREFALSAAICVHPKGVYGDEGGSMCCPITHTRDASFAPAPADERAAFESLKGAWQSMPPFDVFCAGWRAARAASANETGAEGAEQVAQWQSRLKDRSPPVGGRWVNISPDGAKTLMEQYADVYEVRALYTAPQPSAQAGAREPKIDAQPEGGEIAESLVPQGEVARSGGAREGLTDEQREVFGGNFGALEQAENLCRATGNDSSAEGLKALSHALHAFLKGADHAE